MNTSYTSIIETLVFTFPGLLDNAPPDVHNSFQLVVQLKELLRRLPAAERNLLSDIANKNWECAE